MLLTRGSSHRLGHALAVSLALVANLIAAGVPVLHAWAHDAPAHAHEVDSGHDTAAPIPQGEHPHGEVHPPALHDDCLLVQRPSLTLALGLPVPPVQLEASFTVEALPSHPVSPVASRAPPSTDLARAPPLA